MFSFPLEKGGGVSAHVDKATTCYTFNTNAVPHASGHRPWVYYTPRGFIRVQGRWYSGEYTDHCGPSLFARLPIDRSGQHPVFLLGKMTRYDMCSFQFQQTNFGEDTRCRGLLLQPCGMGERGFIPARAGGVRRLQFEYWPLKANVCGGSRPPTQEPIRSPRRHESCFNIDPHRNSRKVVEDGIWGTVEEAAPPCNLIGGNVVDQGLARGVATTRTSTSCSHCAGVHQRQEGRTAGGTVGSWTMGGRRSLPAG